MNTPVDQRQDDLRYAEYVLGVLGVAARAAVEQDIRDDPQAAAAVAEWEHRLIPLTGEVASVTPAPYVWARIRDALQLAQPAKPRARLWDNLRLWRWIGLAASAVATACVVLVLTLPHAVTTAPSTARAGYLAATITQDNGVAGWIATLDRTHARMIVVPATPTAFAPGRAPELWLIPPGGSPIALGMIARDRPIAITLSPALLGHLDSTALLAVSVEPIGGSPTGQPTGPVIAKGAISGT